MFKLNIQCLPLLLVLFAAQMTGCRSVPEGSSDVKQQALSFTPPPGMAGVYAIRPFGTASAILVQTHVDYQEASSLATKTYLFGLLPPGKHIISIPPSALGTSFIAEAGKNYFFKISFRDAGHPTIDQLSEADGIAYVNKCNLSGDSHFAQSAYYKIPAYMIPLQKQQPSGRILLVRVTGMKRGEKEMIVVPGSGWADEANDSITSFGSTLQEGLKNAAPTLPTDFKLQINIHFETEENRSLMEYRYVSKVTAETVGPNGEVNSFSAESQAAENKFKEDVMYTVRMKTYTESLSKIAMQMLQSGIFKSKQ